MFMNVPDLPSDISVSRLVGSHRNAAERESDAQLIESIAAGNKFAMKTLYLRHSVRVFRFARRLLASETAAEDIVSEVFFEVWRKAYQFEGRSQVSTWLLAITRNKAVESQRRHSTQALDESAAALIEDPADNPEVVAHKNETSLILRNCLTQLSPAHREVIDLVYYHGRSIDDAAEIIGIGQSTAKTRMFYARKRLGELLAAHDITAAATLSGAV